MHSDNSDFFLSGNPSLPLQGGMMPDGYVVGECIYSSEKGFARIFKAKRGGRLFILKALREEFRHDPVAIAALRKEFDISFSIDIPGVVRTFDMISHPELGMCIVMQYYPGKNLRRLLDDGYLFSEDEIRNLTDSLTTSLKSIHQNGIAHRDIKPSNIIYDPPTGNVTLIDFGCADSADQLNFKADAGTPLYKPDSSLSGQEADRYALSLTLEELSSNVRESIRKRMLKEPTGRLLSLVVSVMLVVISLLVLLSDKTGKVSMPAPDVTNSEMDTVYPLPFHKEEIKDPHGFEISADTLSHRETVKESSSGRRPGALFSGSNDDTVLQKNGEHRIPAASSKSINRGESILHSQPRSPEEAYRKLEWQVEYIVKAAAEEVNRKAVEEIVKVRKNRSLSQNERDSLILLIVAEDKFQSSVLKKITPQIEELRLSPRSMIVRSALYRHYDLCLHHYRDNSSFTD